MLDPKDPKLTEEQKSLVVKINTHNAVMSRSWRIVEYGMMIIAGIAFNMTILQDDQNFIFQTYRLLIAGAAAFSFTHLMNYNTASVRVIVDHERLMHTEPALPGSPNYVKPPEETTQ